MRWRVVWNPYMGQIRWIEPIKSHKFNDADMYGFGYDHKILRFLDVFNNSAERFGPSLPLPFHSFDSDYETVALSCVKDEQLAVLYHHSNNHIMEIWITTKIEPNAVSWSIFLQVDMTQLPCYGTRFSAQTFFIDEEKKVAMVSDGHRLQTAYTIREGGYFKSVNIGESLLMFQVW